MAVAKGKAKIVAEGVGDKRYGECWEGPEDFEAGNRVKSAEMLR